MQHSGDSMKQAASAPVVCIQNCWATFLTCFSVLFSFFNILLVFSLQLVFWLFFKSFYCFLFPWSDPSSICPAPVSCPHTPSHPPLPSIFALYPHRPPSSCPLPTLHWLSRQQGTMAQHYSCRSQTVLPTDRLTAGQAGKQLSRESSRQAAWASSGPAEAGRPRYKDTSQFKKHQSDDLEKYHNQIMTKVT